MSNEPAPVPASACDFHADHASCHQFQRLLEESSPSRLALDPVADAAGSLNLWETFDGVIPAAPAAYRKRTPSARNQSGRARGAAIHSASGTANATSSARAFQ